MLTVTSGQLLWYCGYLKQKRLSPADCSWQFSQAVSRLVSLKVLKDSWKVEAAAGEGRSRQTRVSRTWSLPRRGFRAGEGDEHVPASARSRGPSGGCPATSRLHIHTSRPTGKGDPSSCSPLAPPSLIPFQRQEAVGQELNSLTKSQNLGMLEL